MIRHVTFGYLIHDELLSNKLIRGNLYDICLLHEEKSLRDSNHHIARFQPSGHMSLRDDIMVASSGVVS